LFFLLSNLNEKLNSSCGLSQ